MLVADRPRKRLAQFPRCRDEFQNSPALPADVNIINLLLSKSRSVSFDSRDFPIRSERGSIFRRIARTVESGA